MARGQFSWHVVPYSKNTETDLTPQSSYEESRRKFGSTSKARKSIKAQALICCKQSQQGSYSSMVDLSDEFIFSKVFPKRYIGYEMISSVEVFISNERKGVAS